jgi:hypothetical protein
MTNRTDKGQFAKGVSGNPGGRPKLPEELRELFRAKGPDALEVLTRCLQSSDERIAIAAATAILDRGYGKPAQTIDANISEETVRFYAEVPRPAASTQEWLENIKREDAQRPLVTSFFVDDEQKHSAESISAMSRA